MRNLETILLVNEIAAQERVAPRTVERWISRGLQASKATQEEALALLESGRLRGLPPKGVWLVNQTDLCHLQSIRKPVGYPKGRSRKGLGAERNAI